MRPSPYDENWNLDVLAIEMFAAELQLNHPKTISIFTTRSARDVSVCGGCGAMLVGDRVDDHGRDVRDFACGHRYVIEQRSASSRRT